MIDPASPDFGDTPVSGRRPRFGYQAADVRSPSITIATPFYDAGEHFGETARAVFGQSLQAFEWLIVDDGSRDVDSRRIIRDCAESDPRVRIIEHPENRGLPAARNTAFREAATPLVLQLDADDLLEPTAAEKWAWYLVSHRAASFVGSYTVGFGAQDYLWRRGFEQGVGFLRENPVVCTSMIRRSVFNAVGGYDETLTSGYEDWDFWLRCADAGFWGATLDEFLNWYRRRPAHDWPLFAEGRQRAEYERRIEQRFGHLSRDDFRIAPPDRSERLSTVLPFANDLGKDRQRLLMILPWLVVGGTETFNLDVCEQLGRDGWDVTVATTMADEDPWLHEFTRLTPDVFRLHSFLQPRDYPRFLSYLIHTRSPDVVFVTNSTFGYELLPWLRREHPDTTFVDYCHMEEWGGREGGSPMHSLQSRDAIDLTLVSSQHLRRWMLERGREPDRVDVVYTNVDTDRWEIDQSTRTRVRSELEVPDGAALVLYAGRLCPQKQPHVFVQVIKRLSDRGHAFVACVAGDGEEASWLRGSVRRNGLSGKVRLLGSVSRERMRELMGASDVFFLPSRWEGIALTLFEAMAAGCAIVAADVGGQSELVTADAGVLVRRSDDVAQEVDRYVTAVEELLRNRDKMSSIGRRARARVESMFSVDELRMRLSQAFARARQLHALPRPAEPTADDADARAERAVRDEELRRSAAEGRSTARMMIVAIRRVGGPLHRFAIRRGWERTVDFNRSVKSRLERRIPRG